MALNSIRLSLPGTDYGSTRWPSYLHQILSHLLHRRPNNPRIDPSSAEIALAQGLYVTSALDGSNTRVQISIVFTSEEYKGSTLEIQGSSAQFERVRVVAIFGGTGKFRLARGYLTFETIHYDATIYYAVIQCNVTVLHY